MVGPRLQVTAPLWESKGFPVGCVSVRTQMALLPLVLKSKRSNFSKLLIWVCAQGCWSFPTLALTELATERVPYQISVKNTLDNNHIEVLLLYFSYVRPDNMPVLCRNLLKYHTRYYETLSWTFAMLCSFTSVWQPQLFLSKCNSLCLLLHLGIQAL